MASACGAPRSRSQSPAPSTRFLQRLPGQGCRQLHDERFFKYRWRDNSLRSNTTGEENAAYGAFSLEVHTTGSDNTAIGKGAMGINQVAEEVADAFPELAVRGADGQVETVHYETLNVLLLNELQKQQAHLDEQSEEQQKQARRVEALERQLKELLRRPAGR